MLPRYFRMIIGMLAALTIVCGNVSPSHANRAGQPPAEDGIAFIQDLYSALHIRLPSSLQELYRQGSGLPNAKLANLAVRTDTEFRTGDLLFFGGSGPEFAGVYTRNNRVAISRSGDRIVERTLRQLQSDAKLIGVRRLLSESDQIRLGIVLRAEEFVGTPYVYGAKYGQTKSFDCSSFVKTVFAQTADIDLPRISREQAKQGIQVSKNELRVGDLLFFRGRQEPDRIGHVAIYAGNGRMIHTYKKGGVQYTDIDRGVWAQRYVTARRIIQ